MKKICVFCGSSPGTLREYALGAEKLGQVLLKRGIGLVFGGARFGLMGRLADTVLAGGGEVTGVMPSLLVDREVAHPGLSELLVVDSMHDRKALMAELSDAFVALPGGLGTIEELLEMLTWVQLDIHHKPCGILNIEGYFNHLLAFLDVAAQRQFLTDHHRSLLLDSDEPETLLDLLQDFSSPAVNKVGWILDVNNTIGGNK